eukprot:scaffold88261_cov37-Prasinocladus_malaysianus.AAC.1
MAGAVGRAACVSHWSLDVFRASSFLRLLGPELAYRKCSLGVPFDAPQPSLELNWQRVPFKIFRPVAVGVVTVRQQLKQLVILSISVFRALRVKPSATFWPLPGCHKRGENKGGNDM